MLASEVIKRLQELIKERGDLYLAKGYELIDNIRYDYDESCDEKEVFLILLPFEK